jgi:hypothetical protein
VQKKKGCPAFDLSRWCLFTGSSLRYAYENIFVAFGNWVIYGFVEKRRIQSSREDYTKSIRKRYFRCGLHPELSAEAKNPWLFDLPFMRWLLGDRFQLTSRALALEGYLEV